MPDPGFQFSVGRSEARDVLEHLRECDGLFDPPLSQRVDLEAYASRIVENAVCFECWLEDRLVGLVAVYENDEAHKRAFVTSVSTVKGFGGRGIGTSLMKAAVEHADDSGFDEIALEVSKGSGRAVRLYTGLGFSEIGSDGQTIQMSRVLREGA